MNVLDAAYRLGREFPGGVPALAQRLGMSANTLAGELNPNHPNGKLGAARLVGLMVISRDFRPLHVIAQECEHLVLPIPCTTAAADDATLKSVARLTQDFGELLTELSASMADGRISDNELGRIEADWQQLLSNGSALLARLLDINQAAKPAELRRSRLSVLSDRAQARS